MDQVTIAVLIGIGIGGSLAVLASIFLHHALMKRERESQKALRDQAESELRVKAEALRLEAREEALQIKTQAEEELRDKRVALERLEGRLCAQSETADTKEAEIAAKEAELSERLAHAERLKEDSQQKLQQVAQLTPEQARELVIARFNSEFEDEALRRAKEREQEILQSVDRRARELVLETTERLSTEYVIEATTALVEIPSEDIKGRIIGREGRNIRSFEQTTGVDLIVDETPDAVLISSFDPVRREAARLTLMNLMLDGRIHPGRIEELHAKSVAEVERTIKDAGERAADRAQVSGLSPRVMEALGRLRFRTSYAQNVLDHSVETAELCGLIAAELGCNVELAKRAGLLHDIGKGLGSEWEGPHALAGMEFLKAADEKDSVCHAVGAHHREIEPLTAEAQIVIVADSISAARPGARRESLENYLKRLAALEQLANSFPGVERSYAVQAGREIRLLVRPDEVDDLGAARLANEVARKIEHDLEFPGQVKVIVIRETRATDTAK